jgi:2-polyprenyl-3-methyl-5-hydroxy-6-metoxy-1,4-benzoquinol methylase
VCGGETPADSAKRARIRSNIRRFAGETFALWQCAECRSIHATDEVDLDHYYAHYPFHDQQIRTGSRLIYGSKLRELERLGLSRAHRVLDYGCGGGVFVQYLIEQGYEHARGYDPYVKTGPSSLPPGKGYDVVLSQDVIEHVDDPRKHLETLMSLCIPGGLLVLGTPNAAVVDLDDPAEYIHALHQPYHRHILTLDALVALAKKLNLEFVKAKPGFIGNRAIPGLNGRYLRRVLRAQGDTLDDMIAGKSSLDWHLFTPAAIWDALTGSFRDPGNDMSVSFRMPSEAR